MIPTVFRGAGATAPRNETPMGEDTRFFRKSLYEIKDDGDYRNLTFFFREPQQPEPGMKYPLVLVLHDRSGNAPGAAYLVEMYRRYPAFILVPALPRRGMWMSNNEPKDYNLERLPDTVRLIKNLEASYPIDPARIYVIGCSEGGLGAFGAARYYGDVFADAVSIGGGWPVEDAKYLTKTPLLAIHGAQDTHIPASSSRDIAIAVKKLGGKIGYIEEPNMGYDCVSKKIYSEAVWDWLFSYHM
jgi:predicted peptidase